MHLKLSANRGAIPTPRLRFAAIALMTTLGSIGSGDTLAAIPGAGDPKAYTEHDYRKQGLEFQLRTSVESYKKLGRRDPKWDDDAIALLDGMARRFADAGAGTMYRLNVAPPLAETRARGAAAVASGCDDPLVLDMYAVTLMDSGEQAAAAPIVRRAAERFAASDYPPFRQLNSARRLLNNFSNQAEQPQLYETRDRRCFDLTVATLTHPDVRGIDRRFVYQSIDKEIEAWPIEKRKELLDAIESKGEPWLHGLLAGNYHVRLAWNGRGSGYANTVTDEGWRVFREELETARRLYISALEAEAGYPEVAARMIVIAMAGAAPAGEDERFWLDRAIAAQLDYDEAYENYFYAMLPRWSGSHQQIVNFGMECADTKRFDTRVPYYLINALNRVRHDGAGWLYWSAPGMFERAQAVLEGYAAAERTKADASWYRAAIVGYAWQVNRYSDARKALDAAGGNLDRNGFSQTGVLPERTISGVHAMSGPLAKVFQDAESLASPGKVDEAVKAYLRIAQGLKSDDPALRWAVGRAAEHRYQGAFVRGDWVDLLAGYEPAAWEVVAGNWNVEGEGAKRVLIGTSDQRGQCIVTGARFGARYELTATFEIIDAAGGTDPGAGVVFGWSTNNQYNGYWLYPKSGNGTWRYEDNGLYTRDRTGVVEGPNTVTIRAFDDHAYAVVNDQEDHKLPIRGMRPFTWQPDARIGISEAWAREETKVRFTALKIRRLNTDPLEKQ